MKNTPVLSQDDELCIDRLQRLGQEWFAHGSPQRDVIDDALRKMRNGLRRVIALEERIRLKEEDLSRLRTRIKFMRGQ